MFSVRLRKVDNLLHNMHHPIENIQSINKTCTAPISSADQAYIDGKYIYI